jgi:hypothetical protein
MNKAHLWRAPCAAFALLTVAACGVNPIVTWDRLPEPPGNLDSMEVARARADTLKRALHEKAREQVGTQVALNDALLGLGALAVVAGVSSAHRDVYTGLALAGGTGYLYSVQNVPKSRLDAYQSGIGAVNCAVQAVLPLQVGSAELREIIAAARNVERTLPTLASKLAAAKRVYAVEAVLSEALSNEVRDQLQSASDAYAAALASLSDAALLPSQVALAAGQLKGTLETIDAQVNRLVSSTVADPAATTRAIADLAQIAGKFAPGLGVDKLVSTRLAARGSAQSTATGSVGVSAALSMALNDLSIARAELQASYLPLAARLAPFKGHTSTETLKACGVSDAVIAIRVEPEEVIFSTGIDEVQSRVIRVQGGAKPYVARFLESPTRGLEVISPLPGDSTVEIRASKNITATFDLSVLVMDASSGGQSKVVKVRIEAPPQKNVAQTSSDKSTKVATGGTKAGAVALAADLSKLATAFAKLPKDQDFAPVNSTHQFRFTSANVIGTTLNVAMTCVPGTGPKDSRFAVQKAVIAFAEANSALASGTEMRLQQRINPQGVAACTA